ncbi:glycosyltransferase [Mucilaginibacter sp.]|uniref:glycosyltransferase n=1 Tax=Mucilaginibacter sp. TaxID=1882438 RepID=UPI0035BBFEC3
MLQSIPPRVIIHKVGALSLKWTTKFGLGSIGLRSLIYYKKYVDRLLKANHFDLIFFSTTQFPVCILGAWWKKKFGIPYVIDMQDPWHSDYYRDKPRNERPPKYWFSYRLNKYLEPLAVGKADGLMAVSEKYIRDLKARYPRITHVPEAVITFGAFAPDLKVAQANRDRFINLAGTGVIRIVYVGRAGTDMHQALRPMFKAIRTGLSVEPDLYKKFRFYFIGTSYARQGSGIPTVEPLAARYGLGDQVYEFTDRISYYHTLSALENADALLIPGSDDPNYTPSKLYPYLLSHKPLLAIFHEQSTAVNTLQECVEGAAIVTFGLQRKNVAIDIGRVLSAWAVGDFKTIVHRPGFQQYSAEALTGEQVKLFDQVISNFEK